MELSILVTILAPSIIFTTGQTVPSNAMITKVAFTGPGIKLINIAFSKVQMQVEKNGLTQCLGLLDVSVNVNCSG